MPTSPNAYNCVHKWVARPRINHYKSNNPNIPDLEYPAEIEVYCDNICGLYCWIPMPPIEDLEVQN